MFDSESLHEHASLRIRYIGKETKAAPKCIFSVLGNVSGALSKRPQTIGLRDKGLPVNTEKFYNLESELVPADQKFFHRFDCRQVKPK